MTKIIKGFQGIAASVVLLMSGSVLATMEGVYSGANRSTALMNTSALPQNPVYNTMFKTGIQNYGTQNNTQAVKTQIDTPPSESWIQSEHQTLNKWALITATITKVVPVSINWMYSQGVGAIGSGIGVVKAASLGFSDWKNPVERDAKQQRAQNLQYIQGGLEGVALLSLGTGVTPGFVFFKGLAILAQMAVTLELDINPRGAKSCLDNTLEEGKRYLGY